MNVITKEQLVHEQRIVRLEDPRGLISVRETLVDNGQAQGQPTPFDLPFQKGEQRRHEI